MSFARDLTAAGVVLALTATPAQACMSDRRAPIAMDISEIDAR